MNDIVERLVDPRYCGQEVMRFEAAETILALRKALAGIFDHFKDREQAPGHSHDVPGIWDSDNDPAIAGKPCEWCTHWNAARAALATEAE